MIAKQKDAIPHEFLAICRPLSFQLKNKETLSSLLNWFLDESLPVEAGDLIFFKVHLITLLVPSTLGVLG